MSALYFFKFHRLIVLCLLVLPVSFDLDARKRKKDVIELALNAHDNFGKTHFIVGMPQDQVDENKKKSKNIVPPAPCDDESFGLLCNGRIKQVFFAPDDRIQKLLLYLINQEQKSIHIAAFSFTDGDYAQALIAAFDRGIVVEVVVDPVALNDKFNKIELLQEHKVPVYIYNPYYTNKKKSLITSLQHNKFLIFGKNFTGKQVVLTGSLNLTKSAHQRNQENVIVFDDEALVTKYVAQHDVLKTRCHAPKKRKIKESEENFDDRPRIPLIVTQR